MKILFIGNSYTYFNDMPALFAAECEKRGVRPEVKSVTAGGYMLSQFLSDEDEYGRRVKQLLNDEKFDYVVLQEQSVLPATDTESFLSSVSALAALIRKNGAKPVLYQTWGRAEWSETLGRLGMTHDGHHAALKRAYEKAASDNGALLVYAGDRFDEAYKKGEQVYDPDGSHPSLYGSEITAKEFCRALMG